MPQDRLSMRKIRDVLRYRYSAELSLEATARALKISKGVVAKYIKLATIAGISWPTPEELNDRDLERLLLRQGPYKEPTYAEPDHAQTHQELKKERCNATFTLGGVPANGGRSGLPIHSVLYSLPRLGCDAQALNAPGPPRGREALCRLRWADGPRH
jgi:hypothetical protein